VAKKGWKKTTPEEWARQAANQRRIDEVIERALRREGLTREEVFRRAGLPAPEADEPA
jgi:hypothetical protein